MRYLLSVLSLSISFAFLFWYAGTQFQPKLTYLSPLPDFLTLGKNKQATFLDIWLPFLNGNDSQVPDLYELTAKSVLMYDVSTDKVLFEKNPRMRTPMASLTKIMTAIIAIENKRSDDSYVVSENNLVGEDSMGLTGGEILTKNELLYGLMLPSGNDAAEVLASQSPLGGRGAFVRAMNEKAKVLGLKDTKFSNPSGLQGDGDQHTTAYDLLVLTRYALENFPELADIVATPEYEIPENSYHKAFYLTNETNLLTTYPGVKGVKTGYTPEAGLCLITYLDYKDHKIIGILLNSENRRKEMKELLDYSLTSLKIDPPEYTGG